MRRASLIAVVITALAAGACTDEARDGPRTPPAPTPASRPVPNVVGESFATARALLRESGLRADKVERYSRESPGTVLRSMPEAGSNLEEGAPVRLVVAKALPRIPNVVGVARATAKREIRQAGFRVGLITKEPSNMPQGTIIRQRPSRGTRARPGRWINLTVAEPPSSNDYSPPIPPGPDVDCAGGSGDGPRYEGQGDVPFGPFRVIGFDIYGLDGNDNDGVGCE